MLRFISRAYSSAVEGLHKNLPDRLYRSIEIETRCNDPAVLRSYMTFALMATNHLNIKAKSWSLKKHKFERLTLLKSAFVNKKHRVQYEMRTYYKYLLMEYLTGSTADTILEYLQRNLPEGVALKATRVEIVPLPDYILPKKSKISDQTEEANTKQSLAN